MALRDDRTHFGTISIINHWTIAALIIIMLGLGLYMDDMSSGPQQDRIIGIHQSIGVLVLFLAAWRVLWRLIFGFPEEVAVMPRWQANAARAAHIALLVLILAMPVSGYIHASTGGYAVSLFGLFELPALPQSKGVSEIMFEVHETLADLLMVVIVVHVAAALKHHVVDKDATLKRMLGRA